MLCLQILDEAKRTLLHCATPESVVRLTNSSLPAASRDEIEHIYFKEQCHENIFELAHRELVENKPADSLYLQVCQSLSLRFFNGHFPGEPGSAGVY